MRWLVNTLSPWAVMYLDRLVVRLRRSCWKCISWHMGSLGFMTGNPEKNFNHDLWQVDFWGKSLKSYLERFLLSDAERGWDRDPAEQSSPGFPRRQEEGCLSGGPAVTGMRRVSQHCVGLTAGSREVGHVPGYALSPFELW